MADKVIGEVGFKGEKRKVKNEDFISKEETMFKIDNDGKALPEKFPIYLYDRDIDRELIEESFLLLEAIKRLKAIKKITAGAVIKQQEKLKGLKDKVKKETDEKKKEELTIELNNMERVQGIEGIKTEINENAVEEGIIESRRTLTELKEEKAKQTVKKYAMICPCTTAEALLSVEKGKTIEGEETNDWVADLISKKCTDPKYTLEEAKRLKPNYKIALKQAIMAASNYSEKSYRDIMMEKKLSEERPLTLKKEKTTGE